MSGPAARESLERLTAALQVAVRALEDMTDSSREACVALDTIERILSGGRESLRALMMEGARSAPAGPAGAAYFDDLRGRIGDSGDPA